MPVDLPVRRRPQSASGGRTALAFIVAALGAIALILALPTQPTQSPSAATLVLGP